MSSLEARLGAVQNANTNRADGYVAEGMKFLNMHYPGAVGRIDPDAIDIRDGKSCMLALASGMSFINALRSLGLELTDPRHAMRGFLAASDTSCDMLNAAWRRALRKVQVA